MHSARWRLACDSREWIAVNLVIANQRRYCDIQHLETACRNQQSGNDYTWLSYWELWFRLPVDSFDSSLWVGSLDGAPADLKGPRRPVRLSDGLASSAVSACRVARRGSVRRRWSSPAVVLHKIRQIRRRDGQPGVLLAPGLWWVLKRITISIQTFSRDGSLTVAINPLNSCCIRPWVFNLSLTL